MRTAHDRLAQALPKLKTAPDDPAANLALGTYLCFARGEWDDGLPRLARGSDAAIASASKQDLARPDDAAARAKAGDAWWDLGESRGGPAGLVKDGARQRAAYWYRSALAGASGLERDSIRKKVWRAARVEDEPQLTVYRYVGELGTNCYPLADAAVPDELAVTQKGSELHVAGTKHSDAKMVHGALVGYFGKAALTSGHEAGGTVDVTATVDDNSVAYRALLMSKGGKVKVKDLHLQRGTVYTWSVSEREGQVVYEFKDKDAVLESLSLPAGEFASYGVAAVLRRPGDSLDLRLRWE